jgi:hypothetical protein
MAENMASQLLDKSGKFYQAALGTIKAQLALIGTNFVVLRPKDNSKWKNVFGGSYSSESTLENDYDQLTTTLLINMNDMKDVWNRNRDSLEAITDDGSLEVGDELQYTRAGRTFRFKISLKQGYSETADTIFAYTLMSIIETLA